MSSFSKPLISLCVWWRYRNFLIWQIFAKDEVLQASRKQHVVAVTHLWWRPRSLQLSVSIMVTCTSEAWSAQQNSRTKCQGCESQTWTTQSWGKPDRINWQSLLISPHTNQNKKVSEPSNIWKKPDPKCQATLKDRGNIWTFSQIH